MKFRYKKSEVPLQFSNEKPENDTCYSTRFRNKMGINVHGKSTEGILTGGHFFTKL